MCDNFREFSGQRYVNWENVKIVYGEKADETFRGCTMIIDNDNSRWLPICDIQDFESLRFFTD